MLCIIWMKLLSLCKKIIGKEDWGAGGRIDKPKTTTFKRENDAKDC